MNCSRPGSGARATGPAASTSRPPAATASAKRGIRTQTITNTCSHLTPPKTSGSSGRRNRSSPGSETSLATPKRREEIVPFCPTSSHDHWQTDVLVTSPPQRVAAMQAPSEGGAAERNGEGSRHREPSLQLACKPDSVVSSHPSERPTWTSAGNLLAVLLGLASGGVCLAAASPRRRCALTAPFQPCRPVTSTARHGRGRCVSVALSRGFPRVGVTDHPALRCPDFPRRANLRDCSASSGKVARRKGIVNEPSDPSDRAPRMRQPPMYDVIYIDSHGDETEVAHHMTDRKDATEIAKRAAAERGV